MKIDPSQWMTRAGHAVFAGIAVVTALGATLLIAQPRDLRSRLAAAVPTIASITVPKDRVADAAPASKVHSSEVTVRRPDVPDGQQVRTFQVSWDRSDGEPRGNGRMPISIRIEGPDHRVSQKTLWIRVPRRSR